MRVVLLLLGTSRMQWKRWNCCFPYLSTMPPHIVHVRLRHEVGLHALWARRRNVAQEASLPVLGEHPELTGPGSETCADAGTTG